MVNEEKDELLNDFDDEKIKEIAELIKKLSGGQNNEK